MGLLKKYGIPVPRGKLAETAEEAYKAAQSFSIVVDLMFLILFLRHG